MKVLRRLLGILVMLAGLLGLVLSVAGIVGVWALKPNVAGYAATTIHTLDSSVKTSQKAMQVTGEALGATVDSVNALSSMLEATAKSVEDTQPVLTQVNTVMGETLPSTLQSASDSLRTAQQAAGVLDSAIQSLENFQAVLSATPMLSLLIEQPKTAYNPDVPLADSLGSLADELDSLPATFTSMSANMDKADDNLTTIQDNLTTMSTSVGLISQSLGEYQTMVQQSQTSMDDLSGILASLETNLDRLLNAGALVMSLFLGWLLIAQVVILTQGWELYQGTAGRLEGGEVVAEVPAAA